MLRIFYISSQTRLVHTFYINLPFVVYKSALLRNRKRLTPEPMQNCTFLLKLFYTKLKTFSLTSDIAELGGGNNSQLNARPSGDFKGPQCDRLTSGLRMGRRAGNHAGLQRDSNLSLLERISPSKNRCCRRCIRIISLCLLHLSLISMPVSLA